MYILLMYSQVFFNFYVVTLIKFYFLANCQLNFPNKILDKLVTF